jgi:hypothetical protein
MTCNRREADQEGATTDVARLAKNAVLATDGTRRTAQQ